LRVSTLKVVFQHHRSIAPTQVLARTHDFNHDGQSDIAWQDSSGNVAIWLMSGNQLLQGGGLGQVDPTIWKIVGQRDWPFGS
jgi:hypothetical protein